MQSERGVALRVPTMAFSKPSLAATMCTAPYRMTPPTSPCPTLSADTEPARKRAETIFSAQCDVTKSAL